jgi:hypothetical protein
MLILPPTVQDPLHKDRNMSQDRMDAKHETAKPAPAAYQPPSVNVTASKSVNAEKRVRVVHGANEDYFDLQNKTVGMARKSLKEAFNIPGDAEAQIGGEKVGDDHILQSGMALEFVKEAGRKGFK